MAAVINYLINKSLLVYLLALFMRCVYLDHSFYRFTIMSLVGALCRFPLRRVHSDRAVYSLDLPVSFFIHRFFVVLL
jgi:hypothetical protein